MRVKIDPTFFSRAPSVIIVSFFLLSFFLFFFFQSVVVFVVGRRKGRLSGRGLGRVRGW